MSERHLLDEQIAYYRARAAEYDATSTPDGDPFAAHGDTIRAALHEFAPRGRVIELAAGTGQWTGILADHADDLLVTDASPEMLELNRLKVGERPNVAWRVEDAFSLEPTHDRDVVAFGFFLSHVPPAAFDAFWTRVAGILAPGGRAFFIDEAAHDLWEEEWADPARAIVNRRLQDGTLHRAVKVRWRPDDLERRLETLGWTASVRTAGPFLWGSATR